MEIVKDWLTVRIKLPKKMGEEELEVKVKEMDDVRLAKFRQRFFLYDSDNKVWYSPQGYQAKPTDAFALEMAYDTYKRERKKRNPEQMAVYNASKLKVISGASFDDFDLKFAKTKEE